MAEDPTIVVVDANSIVQGSWRLDSAAWRVLLYRSRSRAVRLVVPELVVREVVARFASEVEDRASKLSQSAQRLESLVGPGIAAVDVPSPQEVTERFSAEIRTLLAESGVEVPGIPPIDLERLVEGAVSRRRPFDDKGSGFRDAILWETVVLLAAERPGTTVGLLTNDQRAFWESAENQRLHPHLVDDIESRGVSGRVEIFRDPVQYLDSIGIADSKLMSQVAADMDSAQASLTEALRSGLVNSYLEPGGVAVVRGKVAALEFTSLHAESIGGAADANSDVVLVHLVAELHLVVEVRDDARAVPQAFSVEIDSLPARGTATYDRRVGTFSNVELRLPTLAELPELASRLEQSADLQWRQAESHRGYLDGVAREAQVGVIAPILEAARRAQEQQSRGIAEMAKVAQSGVAASLAEFARKAQEQQAAGLAEIARQAQAGAFGPILEAARRAQAQTPGLSAGTAEMVQRAQALRAIAERIRQNQMFIPSDVTGEDEPSTESDQSGEPSGGDAES